jgi:hypothetical protein
MPQFADNITQVPVAGQHGNLNSAEDGRTLAALPIADFVDLLIFPAGSKLIQGVLITAALGASTTLSVGWRYRDGTAGGSATALLAATSTASAARTNLTFVPLEIPNRSKEVVIFATAGGAAATGRVDMLMEYRTLGGK